MRKFLAMLMIFVPSVCFAQSTIGIGMGMALFGGETRHTNPVQEFMLKEAKDECVRETMKDPKNYWDLGFIGITKPSAESKIDKCTMEKLTLEMKK